MAKNIDVDDIWKNILEVINFDVNLMKHKELSCDNQLKLANAVKCLIESSQQLMTLQLLDNKAKDLF